MITVHLHGPFRAFHDGPVQVEAMNAREAIEAVTSQLAGFRPDPVNGRKTVRCAGMPTMEHLEEYLAPGSEIHLMPHLFLSKDSSITQIVIGAVLITVGIFMGGATWPAVVISMGASLVMGGMMQLLAPQPGLSDEEEQSAYSGAPRHTYGIGTRISLGYGEDLHQGHVISSDVDAAEFQ